LHGCQHARTAEEVHQDVAGVGIEVDLLDQQADELALLLLSPCIEDLTEDLPATLHDAWVDSGELAVGLGPPSTLEQSREAVLPVQRMRRRSGSCGEWMAPVVHEPPALTAVAEAGRRWSDMVTAGAASSGDADTAIGYLRIAVDAGYVDRVGTLQDPDLTILHDELRFQEVLESMD